MTQIFGTKTDGTLVPIQANSKGQLVAQGLDGPPGPEGPPGPPGVTWPGDPFEGAFLSWVNGAPKWVGDDSPIVVPGNRIGPILGVANNLELVFGSTPDPTYFYNGAKIVAVDENGNWKAPDSTIDSSEIWSRRGSVESGTIEGSISSLFNSNEGDGVKTSNLSNTVGNRSGKIKFDPPIGGPGDIIEINGNNGSAFPSGFASAGCSVEGFGGVDFGSGGWIDVSNSLGLKSISFSVGIPIQSDGSYANSPTVRNIRLNGRPLRDGPQVKGTIDRVSGSIVILSSADGLWFQDYWAESLPVLMSKRFARDHGF